MRWEDERYVRLYTRDTVDWQFLSFEAQGLLALILRKVDRAGILRLGRHDPAKAVAAAIGHPTRWETVGAALTELLNDRCVVINDGVLVMPNFLEAQEAKASDRARQQKARELARDTAAAPGMSQGVTDPSHGVTKEAENVTRCHTTSHAVTPSRAVPSRAVPSEEDAPASPPPFVLEPQGPPAKKKATDPRWKPLVDLLCADFLQITGSAYRWQGAKDSDALKELLAHEKPEGIRERWRFSLMQPLKDWLHSATIAQLRAKWNDIAAASIPRIARAVDPCDVPGCDKLGTHELGERRVCRDHEASANTWWQTEAPNPERTWESADWEPFLSWLTGRLAS